MIRSKLKSLLPLLALPLLAQVATAVDIHDGFEGASLGNLWQTSRLIPSSVEMQSNIVRVGHGAVKITLRPGDMFEAGANGNSDSERNELMESRNYVSVEDATYESSWSMYLPSDFPIVPTRLVVAQWKEFCHEDVKVCSDDSPVLALRYSNGLLQITQDIDHQFHVLYETKRDIRSKWLELRFRTDFTSKRTGRIEVWIDKQKVIDFTGATANRENSESGYTSPGHFFFKMGLYRNVMSSPMTIYLDDYSKRRVVSALP